MSPTRQRALIVGLIIIGILIVGFFGLRTFHAFREFRGHRPPPPGEVETDVELIRDWMTIPFISKMYHVPPPELFHALDIPPNGNQGKSLNDLNREYYAKENGIVLEKVRAAVLAALANQPPPEPAKTDIPPATAIPPKP